VGRAVRPAAILLLWLEFEVSLSISAIKNYNPLFILC